jgi:hypothetical protein
MDDKPVAWEEKCKGMEIKSAAVPPPPVEVRLVMKDGDGWISNPGIRAQMDALYLRIAQLEAWVEKHKQVYHAWLSP